MFRKVCSAEDGVTGTTFGRPKFNEMFLDIEDGKIDTVIVKDLSRLGRPHNLTDYYMETYFPDKSVRFIAILDHIDSS